MKSKEQYEELIHNSPLFEMDKDAFGYESESKKLCRDIAEYYSYYVNPNFFCDGGGEVFMDTYCSCVKEYNKELGNFLNYFNKALKTNYSRKKAKEEIENARGGISVSEKKQRLASKIVKFAKSYGLDLNDKKNREIIADQLNIDISDIDDSMLIINISAISNTQYDENGEEFDLFDLIASKAESDGDYDEILDTYFNVSVSVFEQLQNRQKELISLLFSRECFMAFENEYGADVAHEKLKTYNFYRKGIYKFFVVKNRVPTQKELAIYCKVSEQSASRSYNIFKKKIVENVKF